MEAPESYKKYARKTMKGSKVKISQEEDSFEFCAPLHGDILGPGFCSTFEGLKNIKC